MDKVAKDKLARSPAENGGQDAQKDIHPRTGRDRTMGRPRKGYKEEAERDLQGKKMEGHCSTGQSSQRAVVSTEVEE
jgi:hypothetical protein